MQSYSAINNIYNAYYTLFSLILSDQLRVFLVKI